MDLALYAKTRNKIMKILIVGSGAVGKTSLLKVLKSNVGLRESQNGNLEYHRTPFMEFDTIRTLDELNNFKGTLQVYDIAGQLSLPIHAIRDLAVTVLKNTDVIILVFDNTLLQSLLDLQTWITIIDETLRKFDYKRPDMILVQNKMDLPSAVDDMLIHHLLQFEPRIIRHFKLSCMSVQGVAELQKWLFEHLFETQSVITHKPTIEKLITVNA